MRQIDLYVILVVILILSVYSIKVIERLVIKSLTIKSDSLLQSNRYVEHEIISHLDYIINEALNEYIIFNIKSKHINYITTKMEQEIVNALTNTVPERMSKTLITQLSFIYNSDYIGEFLGNHIYLIVVDYVLQFNLDRDGGRPSGETEAKK